MTDRPYLAVATPGAATEAIEAAFTVTASTPEPVKQQIARSTQAKRTRGSFAKPSIPLSKWEELFVTGLRAIGTVRAGIAMAKGGGFAITRNDVDICYANNSRFRVKYDDALKDHADDLEDVAFKAAKKDGAMLRFVLTGLKPEKYGRTSTHVHMTVQDRKTIEQMAREKGVDPSLILADVERYLGSGNQ